MQRNSIRCTRNISGRSCRRERRSNKLALATDAGLLALYGIRQQGNRDPLLFPLLKDVYRLESAGRAGRARALVVHADAENYWVLTAGQLHRLQATFTAQSEGIDSRKIVRRLLEETATEE